MGRFEGKVAVITGVTRPGIGQATAAKIVAEGGRVVICGRGIEGGKEVERILNLGFEKGNEPAYFTQADISDFAQVQHLFDATIDKFGKVDILFNNAGIGSFGETPDADIAEWKRMIDVDLNGTFYCCKIAIPLMRKIGGGVIVNNASMSGMYADYALPAYNAAKGAVINFTRSLALDHGKDHIRANAVCPGFIVAHSNQILLEPKYKDILAELLARVPLGRLGLPDDIANAVCFLASDESAFVTGTTLLVDGGITSSTNLPDIRAAFK
ncbi:MAG TPA: SDR family NAD(P)-dependent oxidoreductase [Alphaproteobacteria bacterium]|nr:SDR family NAD(P)-dependent oxidoreductase [Alphaproteobacteria bacterium]